MDGSDPVNQARRIAGDLGPLAKPEKPLAPAATAPQREQYLEGSQIENQRFVEGHDPRLMFHATTSAPFNAFSPERSDLGIHVGSLAHAQDRLQSKGNVTDGVLEQAQVIPLYAKAKNLLRLEDYGNFQPANVIVQLEDQGILSDKESTQLLQKMRDQSPASPYGIRSSVGERVLREHLKGLGYDGVVYLNRGEGVGKGEPDESGHVPRDMMSGDYTDQDVLGYYPDAHDSYILFDAGQVKSPHASDYDESEKDYLKASGGEVEGDDGDDWVFAYPLNPEHAEEFRREEKAEGGSVDTLLDSTGKPVHHTPEGVEAFKKWFGKSHVINGDGRPWVMNHLTASDFSAFKPGGNDPNLSGPAIWMTPQRENIPAAHNTGYQSWDTGEVNYRSGANVMPLYAKIENPLYILDEDDLFDVQAKYQHLGAGFPALFSQKAIDAMKRDGYDGVFWAAPGNKEHSPDLETREGVEVIAFDRSQIKSAIGNDGTWDHPSDITKAEGGEVFQPRRNLNNLGMYSGAAEAARQLPQERGTLDQMLATMKGVKKEEIDQSRVRDAFAGRDAITRDELASHFEKSLPDIMVNTSSNWADNDSIWTPSDKQARKEAYYHLPENFGTSQEDDLPLNITEEQGQHSPVQNTIGWHRHTLHDFGGEGYYNIDELQSDWAQAGRKHGFESLEERRPLHEQVLNAKQELDQIDSDAWKANARHIEQYQKADLNEDEKKVAQQNFEEEQANLLRQRSKVLAKFIKASDAIAGNNKILHSNAPYIRNTDSWVRFLLKSAFTDAAHKGSSYVTLTDGKEQASRAGHGPHSFIKDAYVIHGQRKNWQTGKKEPTYEVLFTDRNGKNIDEKESEVFDSHGQDESPSTGVWEGLHSDLLTSKYGKSLANLLMSRSGEKVDSAPLVGGMDDRLESEQNANSGVPPMEIYRYPMNKPMFGSGHYDFYDRIVAKNLEALAKEHDPSAKLERLKEGPDELKGYHVIKMTPVMRESIRKHGFKAYKTGGFVPSKPLINEFSPEGKRITKAEGGEVGPAKGINVRSDKNAGIRYADEIVDGNKVYETRDSDSLRPYVGKRVAIVRTGEGEARAIGEVTVGKPIVVGHQKFHKMRDQHLVPKGSEFDIKPGSTKHLYPMSDPVRYKEEREVGRGIVSRKVLGKKGTNVGVDHALRVARKARGMT